MTYEGDVLTLEPPSGPDVIPEGTDSSPPPEPGRSPGAVMGGALPTLAWALAGLTLIVWAQQLLEYTTVYSWVTLAVVVLGAAGVGVILAGSTRRGRALVESGVGFWILFVAVVVGLAVWAYLKVLGSPAYGTDEMAFDQYAAQLLMHGLNPYTHSMAPAFAQFHVSPDGYTFHLDGTPVTSLSYPALSFLVYVPFMALHFTTQLAVVVNVVAWVATLGLLCRYFTGSARALVLVMGSLSVYVAYSVGGVTDNLYMPLLVGAAVAWDRYPGLRGWRSWAGPTLFGLALSIKQTPWLVLPFFLLGIGLEARHTYGQDWRRSSSVALSYLGRAMVSFVAVNGAFVMLSPTDWLHGVLTPLSSHTVPAGQGVIGLSLFMGVGGGSVSAFTLTAVVILGGLLVVFLAGYRSLKSWVFLLPAPVLFFAARSFGSYLVVLVPAAVAAAATTRPATRSGAMQRWWLLAAAGVIAGGTLILTLASAPPLDLSVRAVTTTGQLATVDRLQVTVHNRTGLPQQPHFTLETGSTLTSFWLAKGPTTVPAHSTLSYTLLAPNFFAQPAITGGFQVAAFTDRPGTVSVSRPYRPTAFHVSLVPDAINTEVAVGRPITVHAEVLDQLNRPVPVAGIPVYLGQVIYAQEGLQYGHAIINQGLPGQTPVSALTDGSGTASFTITGTSGSADPTYFEANLVNGSAYYPYGYSEILPIRFR